MIRLGCSSTFYDKNGKKNDSKDDDKKETEESTNNFLFCVFGGFEYEIKSIGLFFSIKAGGSLNGIYSKKQIDKFRKPENNYQNPQFMYVTFNIGYNFASLLF